MRFPRHNIARVLSHQQGVALVASLIILMILTILSISALRTSSLEQIMAGNTQESTRTFEAAESGLAKSLSDTTTFANISSTAVNNYTFSGMGATAQVTTSFVQTTPAPRSAVANGQQTSDVAHFNQRSVATTNTGARTVINQGVKKNIPKAN